jgi:hypothetical protein
MSSDAGALLKDHVARGQHIHLFVRPKGKIRGETQPFHYLGELDFVRWEGDSPITVWWTLRNPVPRELHQLLRVPQPVGAPQSAGRWGPAGERPADRGGSR